MQISLRTLQKQHITLWRHCSQTSWSKQGTIKAKVVCKGILWRESLFLSHAHSHIKESDQAQTFLWGLREVHVVGTRVKPLLVLCKCGLDFTCECPEPNREYLSHTSSEKLCYHKIWLADLGAARFFAMGNMKGIKSSKQDRRHSSCKVSRKDFLVRWKQHESQWII